MPCPTSVHFTARRAVLLLLLETAPFAEGAPSIAYEGRIVRRIELAGSVPEAARDLLDIDVGESYDATKVRRSIQQLFALGSFSDVKVDAQEAEDGVALTFILYPTVAISAVRIEGLPRRLRGWEAALLEEAALVTGRELDVGAVERAASATTRVLRRRGFLWAEVEPELRFGSPRAEVFFHVTLGAQARIESLTVRGLDPQVERHVREKIALAPSDLYDREQVERGLSNLRRDWRKKGYYEAEWTLEEERVSPEGVKVLVNVTLGPRIEIGLEGARLSPKTLAGLVPLASEASLSADLVEESRGNLERYFREQGFARASVDVSTEALPEKNLVRLSFRAETGPRLEVVSVDVTGVTPATKAELLPRLASGRSSVFAFAPFRESVWETDLKEIARYLRQRGFARVEVKGEMREAKPEKVELIAHVIEGPQVFLGSLEVHGTSRIPADAVLETSGLAPGRLFDASEVISARERITNLYRDRGFLQALVDASTRPDASGTPVSVLFHVDEGNPTQVDDVVLSGLTVTRTSIVRRALALQAGKPLSYRAIADTRQNLAATGLFRDVRIEVLPRDDAKGSSDVLITLEEAPRTSFTYGFGYEERDLARVDVELTRKNLWGLNRTASVFARGGLRGNRFIAAYRQPETFGRNLPFILSGFREEETRTGFSFIRWGTGIQISKRLSENRTVFLRYNVDRTRLFDVAVDPTEIDRRYRNLRLSVPSVSGVADRRDDPINPRRGSFASVDLQFASQLLGSQASFVKGLGQQFFYVPLGRQLVGAVGVRLGIAQTFRQDRDALIPITERFFAGGASTLRGFALDEASPKDVQGNPVGGNVLSLVNLELRFPIAGNVGGVLFSDNGTVYRRLSVIRLLNWRYNVGVGFRYNTPLGPLRVDYGVKVDRRAGESFGQLHVSIGHAY